MFFTKHAKILDLAFWNCAETQVSAHFHCQNSSFGICPLPKHKFQHNIECRKLRFGRYIFISSTWTQRTAERMHFWNIKNNAKSVVSALVFWFVLCVLHWRNMPKHNIWHMFNFCQDWMNSHLQPSSDLNKCKKWCFGSWCADFGRYKGLFWIPKLLFRHVGWNIWDPKLHLRHCKHMFMHAKTTVQAPNIEDDCIKTIVLASIFVSSIIKIYLNYINNSKATTYIIIHYSPKQWF